MPSTKIDHLPLTLTVNEHTCRKLSYISPDLSFTVHLMRCLPTEKRCVDAGSLAMLEFALKPPVQRILESRGDTVIRGRCTKVRLPVEFTTISLPGQCSILGLIMAVLVE